MDNYETYRITRQAQARIDAILHGRPLLKAYQGLTHEEAVEIEMLRTGCIRSMAQFHVAFLRGETQGCTDDGDQAVVVTWADVEEARRQRSPQAA